MKIDENGSIEDNSDISGSPIGSLISSNKSDITPPKYQRSFFYDVNSRKQSHNIFSQKVVKPRTKPDKNLIFTLEAEVDFRN